MSATPLDAVTRPHPDEVIALVRRWLDASADSAPDASAARLAGVLRDPLGLDFTIGFIDRVVRAEDRRVAARNLRRLARRIPRFLPWPLRAAIAVGGALAPILPWPVIPVARAVLRGMVSHLVVDASPARLRGTLATLRANGARLNINLLGEAVLGEAEADRRLAGVRELLARDDVDYVSVKVSAVASQLSMWGFDETVDRLVTRLTPLYRDAAAASTPKFINLDMEEYRDLDLTIAVFTRILDYPGLRGLHAGIVLQAYLPDSLGALESLTEWAQARVDAGGAPIKIRLVKGANLAMERVDAEIHGWPLATWGSKLDSDTAYKRMLDHALVPERTRAVRLGVAGHNLFDLAFAWLLASRRKVSADVEVEMLLGMATAQVSAVAETVGPPLLYTPVVHPAEFDSAISYLVRRLEENASSENFMSAVFSLAADDAVFQREADRFTRALAAVDEERTPTNRVQNRAAQPVPVAPLPFANEPDTDPALAVNRNWGRAILARASGSRSGLETLAAHRIEHPDRLAALLERLHSGGAAWGARPAAERADALTRVGEVLTAFRARLIEVMASETGKTIAEADVEVSEAIDFAHYYAERAHELERIDGARFAPAALTLVTPPWNFPVAIPVGMVLSAIAAGSAVVMKPAPQARRCGAVIADALAEAGISRDVFSLVDVDEQQLGRELVTAGQVDRVLLTGSFETAALFRSWRPELPLLAETSGKNAIVVTPSADLDLAVADVVRSAFGHAGQKCSAASLVILVDSVGRSERFLRQLADAASSIRVGYPDQPATLMGPVIEPVAGKLERGLTRLGPGESWLVEPTQLDTTQRLWSPGVRDGVRPGSEFHLTEYFGPVLGIMRAATLDEAIRLQNAVDYGLTAGIHSLDADEVARWLERVEAGNLYVNRVITGAIVRRQPFGGWKRSAVGPGAKAGGPNTLLVLGSWREVPTEPSGELALDGLDERVAALIEASQPALDYEEFDRVRHAALSDAAAWAAEFREARDESGLEVERNVFRYRPTDVHIRLGSGGSVAEAVRVIAAGVLAGARLSISSAVPLPSGLVEALGAGHRGLQLVSARGARRALLVGEGPAASADVLVESEDAWLARIARERPARVRLIGGDATVLAVALGGAPEVAVYSGEVTSAGRIELLPFLHEQAISVTAHRFGSPDPAFLELSF